MDTFEVVLQKMSTPNSPLFSAIQDLLPFVCSWEATSKLLFQPVRIVAQLLSQEDKEMSRSEISLDYLKFTPTVANHRYAGASMQHLYML